MCGSSRSPWSARCGHVETKAFRWLERQQQCHCPKCGVNNAESYRFEVGIEGEQRYEVRCIEPECGHRADSRWLRHAWDNWSQHGYEAAQAPFLQALEGIQC